MNIPHAGQRSCPVAAKIGCTGEAEWHREVCPAGVWNRGCLTIVVAGEDRWTNGMRVIILLVAALFCGSPPAIGAELDADTVNNAQFDGTNFSKSVAPAVVKAQVLLDRAHFSPGEIDGRDGENLKKAITAFAAAANIESQGQLNEAVWKELTAHADEPVITDYTISDQDTRGPFAEKIPTRMEDMKELPALSYTSAREALAEKFHMSEALLSGLNPGESFDQPGKTIKVTNVDTKASIGKVTRLEVDKTVQTLKAFDRDDELVAFFPVTAGSTEKPAPSGRLKVTDVSKHPNYRYNPEYAFKGVKSREPFTIKPGPNNPVGLVWIGLSPGQGYGIHGTPDPSKVSKSDSHGCIRLTNWDALALASAIKKGTPVDFGGDRAGPPP